MLLHPPLRFSGPCALYATSPRLPQNRRRNAPIGESSGGSFSVQPTRGKEKVSGTVSP